MSQITTQRYGLCQAIFGWMNFVLVIPGIYLLLGLPLTMREYGWSGTEIGLFQLAGLPAVFKFLLALPVQRFRPGKRHYSNWVLWLVLPLAALLWLISDQSILAHRIPLFLLALGISLLTTWVDIPLNALVVKLLPRSEQMRAGSIRSMALFLGAIVGGGVMLVLQGLWGWEAPFFLMLAGLLVGLLLMSLLKEDKLLTTAPEIPHQPLTDFAGFFRQPEARLWTLLLMTCFPFVGAAWLYMKPLLLDSGVKAQDVAWIVGVGGGIVGAMASVFSGRLVRYLGIARAIPCYLLAALLALGALTLAVVFKWDQRWLMSSIFLVAVAMGGISSLMFGLMMFFTRNERRAADYGLQASLFVVTRLTFPIGAGALLDLGGYSLMLSALCCGVLAVLVTVLLVRNSLVRMTQYTARLSGRDS
ncbi:MFS transporter [uncultured Cedecea sp.]|uniref:MFS transporter n=1 Tax=uncultured Cedecea sp. TaxID=988762 RepID=UPI002616D6B4|nr:MFS transporter [uncultured Cedecea sp.]